MTLWSSYCQVVLFGVLVVDNILGICVDLVYSLVYIL